MIIPAIIVISYNRPRSLERLLKSLDSADYKHNNIPLIISIDYQDSDLHEMVVRLANKFNWKFGKKIIIEYKENLGLREHIIRSGNLTQEYGALIMLEDDIFVSSQFYNYTVKMLSVYGNEEQIAGISLYKHEWNINVNRPFAADTKGFDVFLFQLAQSWGQCWTAGMWKNFYVWYIENQHKLKNENDIPSSVLGWADTSWLKYFIVYVVKSKKYFIYPTTSLTTNFTDIGTHIKSKITDYQVQLQTAEIDYKTPSLSEASKYDVFFEREGMEKMLDFKQEDLCIDLYESKKNITQRYLLTTGIKPFKILKSYGLQIRPHELNIVLNIEGTSIFLYDCSFPENNKQHDKNRYILKFLYDYRSLTFIKALSFIKYSILKKLLF